MAGLHCMCLNPINKCESPLIVHYLYTQYMCVHKYCCPYDDAWTQEVSIPLLSRKSGEDNLPARMPIGSGGLRCSKVKEEHTVNYNSIFHVVNHT